MADMHERTTMGTETSGLQSTAESALNAVTEQGSRALAQAERTAEDAYYATRRFVSEQPVVALATITAFAFALGALWRLTSHRRRFGSALAERVSDYFEPQMRSMRRRSW